MIKLTTLRHVLEVASQAMHCKTLRIRAWETATKLALAADFVWNNLRVLDLDGCTLPPNTLAAILNALRECSGLQELRLDGNILDAHACGLVLGRVLQLNPVKVLGLCDSFWEPTYTWEELMALAKGLPTTLETLYFGGERLGWAITDWQNMLQSLAPRLRVLKLAHNRLGDWEVRTLSERLADWQALEMLDLDFNVLVCWDSGGCALTFRRCRASAESTCGDASSTLVTCSP